MFNLVKKLLKIQDLQLIKKYRDLVSRAWLRDLPNLVKQHPEYMNTTQNILVLADDQVDQYIKGHNHKLNEKDIQMVEELHMLKV